MKTLKYRQKSNYCESVAFNQGDVVRVFTKLNESNLKGWVLGQIDQINGEFYLINLSNNTKGTFSNLVDLKKIFHKSEIRKQEEYNNK